MYRGSQEKGTTVSVYSCTSVKPDGGFVMVCRCISAGSVGDLVKTDEIVIVEKYQILIHRTIISGKLPVPSGNSLIVRHYNDPEHAVSVIRAYLDRKQNIAGHSVMDWPLKSPNLLINEAENVTKGGQHPRRAVSVLQEGWRITPKDHLKK